MYVAVTLKPSQAWSKSLLFPSYVWITYEWNRLDWWRSEHHTHTVDYATASGNCSDEEMERVLEGTLAISLFQTPETQEGHEEEGNVNFFTKACWLG